MNYSESSIDKNILKGLEEMGFVTMTPIQELAIPELLIGRDIIGQAQTGTGKTAAFGIPMIENTDPKNGAVQGLVLCPTRELAVQAAEEIRKMAKYVPGIRAAAIYGGQEIEKQFRILRGKVNIVIGTPGRVMDHMRRGTLHFEELKMLVLDEADEMLNMGFREDIETICKALPEDRQTALFSATMPDEILEIAGLYQKSAKLLKVEQEELTIPLVKQSYYVVRGREKDTSLCRLLDYMSPRRALIFCNTKKKVDQLTLMLKAKGYSAEALHGDLSQHQRDRVMNLFRGGNLQLLLATDVAARGIDVDDVDMVFNYDMPQDMEYYVHRIGRTGRAGKKGKAVSLITSREKYKIDSLEEYCNTRIRRKDMPTAGSAMTVKAYRNVSDAMEYCADKDLTPYMKIVFKRCEDEGYDPLQVAAAFLRMSLGEIEPEAGREISGERQAGGGREKRSKGVRRDNDSRSKDRGAKGFDDASGSRSAGEDRRRNGKNGRKKDNGKGNKKNGKGSKNRADHRGHDKRRAGRRKK
ncbi:MAG: DEAD/DEAH box helicase [Emergencia sp.]